MVHTGTGPTTLGVSPNGFLYWSVAVRGRDGQWHWAVEKDLVSEETVEQFSELPLLPSDAVVLLLHPRLKVGAGVLVSVQHPVGARLRLCCRGVC